MRWWVARESKAAGHDGCLEGLHSEGGETEVQMAGIIKGL